MRCVISYLYTFLPGMNRYTLDSQFGRIVDLPELMRVRYYIKADTFKSSINYRIPKLKDILEYDLREREWFIVKHNYI